MLQTKGHTTVVVQQNPTGQASLEQESQKAAFLQQLQMQFQMPNPRPNPLCIIITHAVVVVFALYLAKSLHGSELYPALEELHNKQRTPFSDLLDQQTDCLTFFDCLYYVVHWSVGLAIWGVLSCVLLYLRGPGVIWGLLQVIFLCANLLNAYGSNNRCAPIYIQVAEVYPVQLPPPPAVYYYVLSACSMVMLIAGKVYSNAQKALKDEITRKTLQATLLTMK